MAISRRDACWISKATRAQVHTSDLIPTTTQASPLQRMYARTHAHTEAKYLRLIAFPRQRWFLERASVLRCTYVACIVSL